MLIKTTKNNASNHYQILWAVNVQVKRQRIVHPTIRRKNKWDFNFDTNSHLKTNIIKIQKLCEINEINNHTWRLRQTLKDTLKQHNKLISFLEKRKINNHTSEKQLLFLHKSMQQNIYWYEYVKTYILRVQHNRVQKNLFIFTLRRTLNNIFTTLANAHGKIILKKSLGTMLAFQNNPTVRRKRISNWMQQQMIRETWSQFPLPQNKRILKNKRVQIWDTQSSTIKETKRLIRLRLIIHLNFINPYILQYIRTPLQWRRGKIWYIDLKLNLIHNRCRSRKRLRRKIRNPRYTCNILKAH